MALEQLLTTRATTDSCCKELELNAELVVHLNEAQAVKAIKEADVHHAATIKEAEVHHTTTVCALQQTHREYMLMLECQVKAEEGWDCQDFVEVFGVALQACLPKTCGALMYPLQLLTGDVLSATILGMLATAQKWAVADGGQTPAASIPNVSEMPAPQAGAKWWCHSSNQRQEEEETVELDDTPEEHPPQR